MLYFFIMYVLMFPQIHFFNVEPSSQYMSIVKIEKVYNDQKRKKALFAFH